MKFIQQVAKDPRKAMRDLERKFGVEPGGLLREMHELADACGEDWTVHLPFDVARSYYEDTRARAPFEEHVNGCTYCKSLLESLHPTPVQAAAFLRGAKQVGTSGRRAAKVLPLAVAAGFAALMIAAWVFFSSSPPSTHKEVLFSPESPKADDAAAKSSESLELEPVAESSSSEPSSVTPTATTPVARNIVGGVKIGGRIDEKGEIAGGEGEAQIVAGQPVHVVTEIEGAPSNTPVTVVWYGPKDERMREETYWTQAGDKALTFHAFDTSAWKSGEYRAELWVGKNKVTQEPFRVWKGERAE